MKHKILDYLRCSSVNTKESYCCRDSHIRTRIFKKVLDGFDQFFLLLYLHVIVNWGCFIFQYWKREVINFYLLFWRLDSKAICHRKLFLRRNPLPLKNYPAGNYMFKVKHRNTRIRCEISSKLTIKSGVVLVSLLLTLNIFNTLL